MTIRIRCLFFAASKDLTGTSSKDYDLEDEDRDSDRFLEILKRDFPKLAGTLQSSMLAVNQEYVRGSVRFNDGDEVAVIPPISGG